MNDLVNDLVFFSTCNMFFPSLKALFHYIPFDREKESDVDSLRGLHHCRVWKHWQMSRGLWVYASKWYGFAEKIILAFAIPLGFFLRLPGWVVGWKDSFCKRS
jgi:hypothetical protein